MIKPILVAMILAFGVTSAAHAVPIKPSASPKISVSSDVIEVGKKSYKGKAYKGGKYKGKAYKGGKYKGKAYKGGKYRAPNITAANTSPDANTPAPPRVGGATTIVLTAGTAAAAS